VVSSDQKRKARRAVVRRRDEKKFRAWQDVGRLANIPR
jgi:hypothetical protein